MSKAVITYDDSNLQKLFAELSEKERLRAIKGAFRREANAVRRKVVLRLPDWTSGKSDFEEGVRAIVFKKKAGFRVTVGTRGKKQRGGGIHLYGYHTNRRNLTLPILMWAEDGTAERHTRSQSIIYKRKRKGHPTGRMAKYGFVEVTMEETRGQVTGEIHDELRKQVTRIAKKYGCK